MCGLTLSIHPYPPSPNLTSILDSLGAATASRGPDSQRTISHIVTLPESAGDRGQMEIRLSASVLGLRGGGGEGIVPQPLKVGARGWLGWNGQVFDGLPVGLSENDTSILGQALGGGAELGELLSNIEGPYACIFLDTQEEKLYFQLDPLSRRSLLLYHGGSTSPEQGMLNGDGGSHDRGSEAFILSSVRSSHAKEAGLEFRVLGGGEGGVVDLKKIRLVQDTSNAEAELIMDLSAALEYTGLPNAGRHSSLTPISQLLPDRHDPPVTSAEEVQGFISRLSIAVKRRVDNIPYSARAGEPRVALLFSGGVDCTLLAGVLDLVLPPEEPVDLINVAFSQAGKAAAGYNTPDRISGLDAWEEVSTVTGREWRFVEVNVTFEECQEHRQRVLELMYPATTEMDLSLAYPLYFASRGRGLMRRSRKSGGVESNEAVPYDVQAKVYLSGLGADEQLGGYARHRHAFRAGWQGLIDEIQMDINRLPTRNLSRDDRLISSHARDARYPYLDLEFIGYLSGLPIWTKCNFTVTVPSAATVNSSGGAQRKDGEVPSNEGTGDKILLRRATLALGLTRTAGRVKRAMQFGTRSSKMSVIPTRGPKAGQRSVFE